jgi:hypothetical protein
MGIKTIYAFAARGDYHNLIIVLSLFREIWTKKLSFIGLTSKQAKTNNIGGK